MIKSFFYETVMPLILICACVAIIVLALAGCAGKGLRVEVATEGPGANQSKSVKILTDYQIENGFFLRRNTETGEYEIELGSATTKDADAGVFMLISQMLEMMRSFMVPGAVSIPPTPTDSVP